MKSERHRANELADTVRQLNEELRVALDDAADGRKNLGQIRERVTHADQVEAELLNQIEIKVRLGWAFPFFRVYLFEPSTNGLHFSISTDQGCSHG